MKNDVDNATLTRRVELCVQVANLLQRRGEEEGGEGEGLTAALGALSGCCMVLAREKDGRVHELYSQCMKLYERRKKEAAKAEGELRLLKDELMAAIEGEREKKKGEGGGGGAKPKKGGGGDFDPLNRRNVGGRTDQAGDVNERNTMERDTDLKKLGAIQRRFDDKELELHDHLDLSTACRFHLHLGLAQVAIGKDGKQHLDEAKKLADELADHDLIWLCDKHTRARASLEC